MKKGIELKQHFHTCMPLFIALGDEIRLTIIEALTDEALTGRTKNNDVNKNQPDKNNDHQISLPAQSRPHGLNVREITERTSLSRPAVSHHLKILKTAGLIDVHREEPAIIITLDRRQHPEIDAARTSAGIRAFHGRLNQDAYLSIF